VWRRQVDGELEQRLDYNDAFELSLLKGWALRVNKAHYCKLRVSG
jgi:hypothetical protein